jgi:multimeric flavodoxin WrbA
MVRILAISGSHRDSNTDATLRHIIKGCEEAGAQVEPIFLREIKFNSCCGWSDCYYKNLCIVQDNLSSLFQKMDQVDAFIFATPVYFDNVSGNMKNFMDRSNPYCKPPRYKGKQVALISVGGASSKSIDKCEAAMQAFCFHHKLNVIDTFTAVADHEKEILKKKDVLDTAIEFGRKFASKLRAI